MDVKQAHTQGGKENQNIVPSKSASKKWFIKQ